MLTSPTPMRLAPADEAASLAGQTALHAAFDWLVTCDPADVARVASHPPNVWPLEFLVLVADLDWQLAQRVALAALDVREDNELLRGSETVTEHGPEAAFVRRVARRWRWRVS